MFWSLKVCCHASSDGMPSAASRAYCERSAAPFVAPAHEHVDERPGLGVEERLPLPLVVGERRAVDSQQLGDGEQPPLVEKLQVRWDRAADKGAPAAVLHLESAVGTPPALR